MTSAQHAYTPEVTAYIANDDRYKRACATLAEVLDLHPDVIERLGLDHDFIKASARLSHVKVMLAMEWHRRNRKESASTD